MRKRINKYRMMGWLLAALLVVPCVGAVSVQADVIDADATGSISVTMQADDGSTVAGGTLELYQVAGIGTDETGDPYYYYTDAFADCEVVLADLTEASLADMAQAYQEYAAYYGVQPDQTVTVAVDGTAYFADLATGIYLVVQSEAADGYYAASPFVVTIPVETDGTYVYDVDASPKMQPVTPIPEEPSEPESEPEPEPESEPEPTPTEPTLPQTGFVMWSLVVMVVCGVVLVIVGYQLAFSKRVRKQGR